MIFFLIKYKLENFVFNKIKPKNYSLEFCLNILYTTFIIDGKNVNSQDRASEFENINNKSAKIVIADLNKLKKGI